MKTQQQQRYMYKNLKYEIRTRATETTRTTRNIKLVI